MIWREFTQQGAWRIMRRTRKGVGEAIMITHIAPAVTALEAQAAANFFLMKTCLTALRLTNRS